MKRSEARTADVEDSSRTGWDRPGSPPGRENTAAWGVPGDVAFAARGVQGWIELKTIKAWPKRPDTPVKVKHFTPQQRVWLHKSGQMGGSPRLFLVERSAGIGFWFNHWRAQDVGQLTKSQLYATCLRVWAGIHPTIEEFLALITGLGV